jgi:hypothetical protein
MRQGHDEVEAALRLAALRAAVAAAGGEPDAAASASFAAFGGAAAAVDEQPTAAASPPASAAADGQEAQAAAAEAEDQGGIPTPPGVWEDAELQPVPARPLPTPEIAEAYVIEKLWPLFSAAGFSAQLITEVRLLSPDPIVWVGLSGMRLPPPVQNCREEFSYTGIHGCPAGALYGILRDGCLRSRPPPDGWGLLFFQAAQSPRGERLRELVLKCFKTNFGRQGLAVRGRYTGHERVLVPGNGHEEEARWSRQGYPTRYGPAPRWTFPEAHTLVEGIYVHLEKSRQHDYTHELATVLAYGH